MWNQQCKQRWIHSRAKQRAFLPLSSYSEIPFGEYTETVLILPLLCVLAGKAKQFLAIIILFTVCMSVLLRLMSLNSYSGDILLYYFG